MTTTQNARQYAQDQMQQGKISADKANVLTIQMEGVRIVTKIPAGVRKALNTAVKAGKLGHLKADKSKFLPEAYFHVNSRARAVELRNQHQSNAIKSLAAVFAS